MKRWDQIASLVGIALGVLLAIFSLRLNLGKWTQPGPGLMPLGSGILLISLCSLYGVRSFHRQDKDFQRKESPWPKENFGKLVAVLIALLLFSFLLTTLGYLLSTFLLMIFLFRILEPERWYLTLIKAALSVLVTYIVFDRWLMVQFPTGLFGV